MKTVECPKCGHRLVISDGATAWCGDCPKTPLRAPFPVFVEVEE